MRSESRIELSPVVGSSPQAVASSSGTLGSSSVGQAAPRVEFSEVLSGISTAIDRGESVVERTLGGSGLGKLDNAELLRLQMSIYRYTEAVDLMGKMVDRASNAVRTTLQNSG
jgi:hypothetical protein